MTITVENSQLVVVKNGKQTNYNIEDIEKLIPSHHPVLGASVTIKFIGSQGRTKIFLREVTNQVTWTDSLAGAQQAVEDINNWMAATATPAVGYERTPGMIRPTGSGDVNTVAAVFYSVSVANVGGANGTILGGTTIKPQEVLNFAADAINNYFTSFAYNATGTEFIITFIY